MERNRPIPGADKRHLEELKRIRRIKLEEMNSCVDRGYLGRRKEILNDIFKLDHEIKNIELLEKYYPEPSKAVIFHGRIFKALDVSDIEEEDLKHQVWGDDGYIEYS